MSVSQGLPSVNSSPKTMRQSLFILTIRTVSDPWDVYKFSDKSVILSKWIGLSFWRETRISLIEIFIHPIHYLFSKYIDRELNPDNYKSEKKAIILWNSFSWHEDAMSKVNWQYLGGIKSTYEKPVCVRKKIFKCIFFFFCFKWRLFTALWPQNQYEKASKRLCQDTC